MSLPTTNKYFHLDVGTFVGADGDPIGSLTDQSTNAFTATSTGGSRPTYKTGQINGYPTARFGGAQALFTTASSHLSAYSGFAVISVTGTSGYRPIVGASAAGGLLWRIEDSTNKQNLVSDFTANIASSTTGLSTATFYLVSFTYTTTAYAFYLGGTADGSSSHAVSFSAGTMDVGYSATNGDAFSGDIAEFVIYDAVLSGTPLSDAHAYFTGKYFGPGTPKQWNPSRAVSNFAAQRRSRW